MVGWKVVPGSTNAGLKRNDNLTLWNDNDWRGNIQRWKLWDNAGAKVVVVG